MIDAKRISAMIRASLWTEEQMAAAGHDQKAMMEKSVIVHGITQNLAFQPENLEVHRAEVSRFLQALDSSFMESGGGGMSFVHMSFDRSGEQWGEQRNAEELLCMGIGLGLCEFLLPRDLWAGLPGGVPYVVVKTPLKGAK